MMFTQKQAIPLTKQLGRSILAKCRQLGHAQQALRMIETISNTPERQHIVDRQAAQVIENAMKPKGE